MTAPDPMTEMAAGYALGALSAEEERAFEEHLAAGCARCSIELESFRSVTALIGFSARPQAPSAAVKGRLIDRTGVARPKPEVATSPDLPKAVLSIRTGEGVWEEVQPGVLVKTLFLDELSQNATSLVRMLPGTRLPMHRHTGVEQFFVLEGDCHVHGEILGPGDYHRAEAGSIHETTFTEGGTLLLLVAPPHYEAIEGG